MTDLRNNSYILPIPPLILQEVEYFEIWLGGGVGVGVGVGLGLI